MYSIATDSSVGDGSLWLCQQMDVRLNLIDVFRQLDKEDRQFWVDLINCYLLNSKYVAVSFLHTLVGID